MLPIHFAPLQGFTEDAYRRIHAKRCPGVTCYYTPFLRLEHGEVRSKDLRDIRPEHNEGVNVVPQVIAKDAAELRKLIAVIEPLGYGRIDINLGCPFPLQTRHGRGAGLLPHPDRVKEICDVIKSHTSIIFSVKMRLGLDSPTEWQSILPLLNDAPLCHITLHPRVASQQYKGEVDMTQFAAFSQACRHSLIYNGDVTTIHQIATLEKDFPTLAGIMIGRGLLANPALAMEYQSGQELSTPQRLTILRELHDALLAHYDQIIPGEAQRLGKIRTFWEYAEDVLGRKAWKKVMKAGNMKNYKKGVAELR